tara:strand:- start:96 stop:599 length:504 start_codon:yes stop_codon:yes gene_type:complete
MSWFNIIKKNYVPSFYQQSQDAQAMQEADRIAEERKRLKGEAGFERRRREELPLGLGRLDFGSKSREQELRQKAKELDKDSHRLRNQAKMGEASGYDYEVELQERPEKFDQGGHHDSFSTFPPSSANEESRAGARGKTSATRLRPTQRTKDAPEAMEGFRPDWQKGT